MRNKKIIMLLLLIAIGSFLQTDALAQKTEETITISKKGTFHINKQVKVGDKLLKSGMYQVEHITEGDDHIIVFREIKMGYRNNMGNQSLGDEVARVKCTVEPVEKKIKNTKLLLRKNISGEREVVEVQVKGETVRHILQVH